MYWFLLADVAGKHPVWSVWMVSMALWILMYTSCIFFVLGVVRCSLLTVCFVDLTPCHCFSICPCCVSSESGKCFLTSVVVSPGHMTSFLLLLCLAMFLSPGILLRCGGTVLCAVSMVSCTHCSLPPCFLTCLKLISFKVLLHSTFFLWVLVVHWWWWWAFLLCGSLPRPPLGEILLCIPLPTSCWHLGGIISVLVIRPPPSPYWLEFRMGVWFVGTSSVWHCLVDTLLCWMHLPLVSLSLC